MQNETVSQETVFVAQARAKGADLVGCIVDLLERYAGWVAAAILVATFLAALGHSTHKRFSYDELATYRAATLPHTRDVWDFFAAGLDTTGPLSALIVHGCHSMLGSPELASRLPFTLAFMGMGFGMFGFLRGRYPAGYALTALLLPLEMPLISFYLTEARGYAFLLGGAGLGAYFWKLANKRTGRPWTVIGLWCALTFAISANFYAIFLFVPFALGQLVHDLEREKLDLPVWAAIFLFPVTWLPTLPGSLLARKYYATHFWSRPDLGNLRGVLGRPLSTSWQLVAVLAVFIFGLVAYQSWKGSALEKGPGAGLSRAEFVFAFALALLPVYAWVASLLLGVFRDTYVFTFSIGLVICVLAGLGEIARRNQAAGLVLFALVLILAGCDNGADLMDGITALPDGGHAHKQMESDVMGCKWVKRILSDPRPIATDNDTYMLLDFYSTPELRTRVYGLTDLPEAAKYDGAMTDQMNFTLFSRKLPIRTMDVEAFVKTRPDFLLVAKRVRRNYTWLPEYLLERQRTKGDVRIQLWDLDDEDNDMDNARVVYEVQMLAR